MKIEELENELNEAIEKFNDNWKKCQEQDALPEITSIALSDFKDCIINFLKEK